MADDVTFNPPDASDKIQTALPKPIGTETDINAKETPVIFDFEGEYSILSARDNVGGKRGAEESCKLLGRTA